MKTFYGTKRIQANPLNRADYNKYRGWDLPCDEDGSDEGFLVVYTDSNSNTEDYDGYVSWSPKQVFEEAYQADGELSFGHAIKALKEGLRVSRSGWNGKGMFLFLVPGSTFKVNRPPLLGIYEEGQEVKYHAHIDMKTSTGEIVPWLASQTDVLSDDWVIV